MNSNQQKLYFEARHIVSFEETNLVGNVYYANHVRWQGYCREMFLREHAPDILQLLQDGLYLVTVRVSCDYFNEFFAFDEVIIRMRVVEMTQSRVTMAFDYIKVDKTGETLMAKGEQQIACLREQNGQMAATPIPHSMQQALMLFGGK